MNGEKQRNINRIEYSKQFLRRLGKLPENILKKAEAKEVIFKANPFHPSLETHKLHGQNSDAWAFSVDYSYRIKFIFLGDTKVLFLDIGTHDIYT